jgi:ferrous-iron efflux pump FieF
MAHYHAPQPEYARLLHQATLASVSVALLLIGVKTGVWLLTGSLSVLASLVDSVLDGAASLLNLVAVRYSLRAADRDHPFGHGKAEYLAGLGQALFVGCSALFVIYQAFQRFTDPRPLAAVGVGIMVMTFAILVTGALVLFQRRIIKQTGCAAIKADSLHYSADLFTNLGTIVALVLAWLGWPGFDPLIAVLIALFVIHSAWQIAFEASQMLMDHQLPAETEAEIASLALANAKVLGVHDIRTRRSGQTRIIQLHLELAGNLTLCEAHRAAKDVERRIQAVMPEADIIIHQDPVKHEKIRQSGKNKGR